jgi:hypothetical protein
MKVILSVQIYRDLQDNIDILKKRRTRTAKLLVQPIQKDTINDDYSKHCWKLDTSIDYPD